MRKTSNTHSNSRWILFLAGVSLWAGWGAFPSHKHSRTPQSISKSPLSQNTDASNSPNPGIPATVASTGPQEGASRFQPSAALTQSAPSTDREASEAVAPELRTIKDRYSSKQTLFSRDSKPDGDGFFNRTKVVQTQMKYPLLRVEERRSLDPETGAERLHAQQSMVADHVIVMLEPGRTAEQLETDIAGRGYSIRKRGENYILISFDGSRPGAIEQALQTLQASRLVQSVSPDRIRYVN